MNKKVQLSLMIIVFVVLLVIILLLFITISENKIVNKNEIDEKRVYDEIRNKVLSCVHFYVEEGLNLLSHQSGIIYKDQGGNIKIDKSRYLIYNGFKVPIYAKAPPEYICNAQSFDAFNSYSKAGYPFNCSQPYNSTYNNINNHKPECYKTYFFNGGKYSEHFFTLQSVLNKEFQLSVVSNLNYYLEHKIQDCLFINMSNNKKGKPYRYKNFVIYNLGGVHSKVSEFYNVSVYFGSNIMTTKVYYPIKVKKLGTDVEIYMDDFTLIINMPFYDYIKNVVKILNREINIGSFKADSSNPECNNDHVICGKIRSAINKSNKYYDLLWIRSKKIKIKGKPLEFWFFIENRPPIPYSFPIAKEEGRVKVLAFFPSWYNIKLGEECNKKGKDYVCKLLINDTIKELGFLNATEPDEEPFNYSIDCLITNDCDFSHGLINITYRDARNASFGIKVVYGTPS